MIKQFIFGSSTGKVGMEYSIINTKTNREMLSQNEILNKLNEQSVTIQELERELNKIGMNHAENIGFKFAVKEVLQRHYKYAENQRQKNLDDVKIASIYNLLRSTIRDIADELEIDLTPSDYDEFWNTKIKHLKVDLDDR